MNRVAILALTFSLVSATQAQTILPGLNFNFGYPLDINDSGLIVGSSFRPDGYDVPVIWENGQIRELENIGFGRALAINSIGDAVGEVRTQVGTPYPALWIGEIGTLLPDLGGGGQANDINDDGVIVGYVFTPDGTGNFLPAKWVDGDLEILSLAPQLGLGSVGVASRINNAGRIVGTVGFNAVVWDGPNVSVGGNPLTGISQVRYLGDDGSFAGNATGGAIFPINWSPLGSPTLLPTSGPEAYGFVNGGSPNGLRVGASWEGVNRYRATVWKDGAQSFLPELMGADYSEAFGANNNNQVVGIVSTLSGEGRPVVWNFNPVAPIVTVPPQAGQVGEMLTFTAHSSMGGQPYAGQSMLFRVADVDLGRAVTDSTGTATLRARIPLNASAGNHELMASLGGSRYGLANIAISRAPSRLSSSAVSGRRGSLVTLGTTLSNAPSGSGLSAQRVTFSGPNRPFTAITAPNGRAQVGYRIPSNAVVGSQIRFQVAFGGNSGHNRSLGQITVTVQP